MAHPQRMQSRYLVLLTLTALACANDPTADAGDTGETGDTDAVCEPYQTGTPGTLTLNYHNGGDAPVYLDIAGCSAAYLPANILGHLLQLSAPCDCTCEALMQGERPPNSCECGDQGACGEYTLVRIEAGGSYSVSAEIWDFRTEMIPPQCVDGASGELMCQVADTLEDGDYTLVTRLWAPEACADPQACACAGDESFCELAVDELGPSAGNVETVMAWMAGATVDIEL